MAPLPYPSFVRPTDHTLSCAARAHVPKPKRWAVAGEMCTQRLPNRSGRPRRLLAPAPLQIRTCRITASGSSNHGFAALQP